MSSTPSGGPGTGGRRAVCAHCGTGIQYIPGGLWHATTRQHDLWGPLFTHHCPGRPLAYGYHQPHAPRSPQV